MCWILRSALLRCEWPRLQHSVARCSELQELGRLGDRPREAARAGGRFERFSLPLGHLLWSGKVVRLCGLDDGPRSVSSCGSFSAIFCLSLPC
jgi:hypothetical protein